MQNAVNDTVWSLPYYTVILSQPSHQLLCMCSLLGCACVSVCHRVKRSTSYQSLKNYSASYTAALPQLAHKLSGGGAGVAVAGPAGEGSGGGAGAGAGPSSRRQAQARQAQFGSSCPEDESDRGVEGADLAGEVDGTIRVIGHTRSLPCPHQQLPGSSGPTQLPAQNSAGIAGANCSLGQPCDRPCKRVGMVGRLRRAVTTDIGMVMAQSSSVKTLAISQTFPASSSTSTSNSSNTPSPLHCNTMNHWAESYSTDLLLPRGSCGGSDPASQVLGK